MSKTKEEILRIRMTSEQKRAVEAAARERGIPPSTWLRILAFREIGIISKAA